MFMSARSPGLRDRLAAEIALHGPMRFSRFMELALYDPAEGYYASGKATVGRDGDFFTNISLGPVFGEILAAQFLEMWETLGRPEDFTLVEQGANDGRLSEDILNGLANTPLAEARLILIEPFAPLREKQQARLSGRRVEWVEAPDELPNFTGVHFSNELFDALPFDTIKSHAGRWQIQRVQILDGAFRLEPAEVLDLAWPTPSEDFVSELRIGQSELVASISSRLQRGFLLAIDYGMTRDELLAPHRAKGTLACYAAHRRDDDPFESIGEKDITAHVDFTSLAEDLRACGLDPTGYTDQHHFLVGAAERLLLSLDGHPPTADTLKKLRSLRTLLHPETMGVQFKVLLASKGVSTPTISGFRHARELPF
jgi:SAM-dependent MidA family methyltransferase